MTRQKNAIITMAQWAALSLGSGADRSDGKRCSTRHPVVRRFASIAFSAVFASSVIWSGGVQAQVTGTPTITNVTPPPPADPATPYPPLAGGGGALWTGGSRVFAADPNGSAGDGVQVYRGVAARLQAVRPACDNGTVTLSVSLRVTNNGPAAGAGYVGHLGLYSSGTLLTTVNMGPSAGPYPVGFTRVLTINRSISAADFAAGRIVVGLWLETYHVGSKSWTANQLQTSYTYNTTGCPADLAITKTDGATTYTPGTSVIYTIVARNNGPLAVPSARVTDPLPTGISSASWTCGGATGGGVCGAASGSGGINTTANLPVGATVTYRLTLNVPSTFSGSLINTARIAGPTNIPDSNTSNNTASDTDTQFPAPAANVANISCSTDAALFNTAYDGSGGRLTTGADSYWQVAWVTTPVSGAPPANLTYGAAQVVTSPPANYVVSPYGNANWISHAANPAHAGNYDVFYRYQFNIGPGVDPTTLALNMAFYSDNSVIDVWVNGSAQGVRSNYPDAAGAYTYAGFVAGSQATGTLGGPWQSGLNEIVVHVKSGPPAQAFLAQVLPPVAVCAPAKVTLNKITQLMAAGPFGFGLTNTAQAAGSVATTAADTPMQVDGDSSSTGTIDPFEVTVFGTDVVITENGMVAGWQLSEAVCTSDGTPVGSRLDNDYTIPGDLIDASAESFECTFINTPTTNLSIDKTVNPTAARAGDTVTYTLNVGNDGPGPGDGAVLADPPVIGVDCDAATLTCSASGGAVCPASLDVTELQGTGLVIPTFPAGGSLQFGMACTVTATGQ